MNKRFKQIAIVAVVILVSFETVYAYSGNYNSVLGGRITDTKATEIKELEDTGYHCELNGGKSITINPIRGPKTYFIPENITSKTGRDISSGRWILGRYNNNKTTITCKKKCGETTCTNQVTLDSITLFGT